MCMYLCRTICAANGQVLSLLQPCFSVAVGLQGLAVGQVGASPRRGAACCCRPSAGEGSVGGMVGACIPLSVIVVLCILSHFQSFTHSFIHSFLHSFIHSFVHSCMHAFSHSFMHSFIQPFIYSFVRCSFVPSLIQSFFQSVFCRTSWLLHACSLPKEHEVYESGVGKH